MHSLLYLLRSFMFFHMSKYDFWRAKVERNNNGVMKTNERRLETQIVNAFSISRAFALFYLVGYFNSYLSNSHKIRIRLNISYTFLYMGSL